MEKLSNLLNGFIDRNPKFKEAVQKAKENLESGKWVQTKNFGIVLGIDYNNSRFWFLKKDEGVPVKKFHVTRYKKEKRGQDAYGKPLNVDIPYSEEVTEVYPEFFEWKKLCKSREESIEMGTFQSTDNGEITTEEINKIFF